MLVAFCTEGEMSAFDIKHECGKEGWVPLLVLKTNDKIILPHFTSNEICRKFCQRNLPKKWLCGGVSLADSDIESIKLKGWEFQEFNFPRLIKDLYSYAIEIHEFASEFETQTVRV